MFGWRKTTPTMGMINTNPTIPTSGPSSLQMAGGSYRQQLKQMVNPATPNPNPNPNSNSQGGRMLWGSAVWYLFHTLAERVSADPEQFAVVRTDLLQLIYLICSNLPCPNCSVHAKNHLDKVNFQAIQDRDTLRQMLLEFHNIVNRRKGYPEFVYSGLEEKYGRANLPNILNNFVVMYTKKTKNIRYLADDLQRAHITSVLREFYMKHVSRFPV